MKQQSLLRLYHFRVRLPRKPPLGASAPSPAAKRRGPSLCAGFFLAVFLATHLPLPAALPPAPGLTNFASDNAFLEYVQRQTFNFFWDEANATNGLIRDRSTTTSPCSVASIGFGLSAVNIAIDRGWITRDQGRSRVLTTLQTLSNLPQGPGATGTCGYRGWFYHFLNMNTGLRFATTELSTIDTALLMLGVIDASQYFDDPSHPDETAIRQLADSLVNRIDWPFVLRTNDNLVTMQWTPEAGYSAAGWLGYSEASCMYLLGLGAATNPLPAASWAAWTSGYSWTTAYGYSFVPCPPLFTHQYSQGWIDFRFIADAYFRARGSDYFENSRRATLAQQQYAIGKQASWPNYGVLEWGLTACDGPNQTIQGTTYFGYMARGAPAGIDDGTIAPTAAAGSMPFAPEICLPTLRHIYDTHLTNIWTAEGFRDAYNVKARWWGGDTIGIDEGPIIIMIENYRTGSVWRRMMRSPVIQRGLERAGFTAPPPEHATATAIATNQIVLSWSGPPSYQTGFQVQRSLDAVNFTVAATVDANVFALTLDALPSTTYFVRVVSANDFGLSAARQTVSVITPGANPLPLVSLVASDAPGTSSFHLPGNWSNSAPPDSANDYVVKGTAGGGDGFCLRTPVDSVSRVFAGGSLTIGDGLPHASPNQLLLAGVNATNTVPDLRLNRGVVGQDSPGTTLTLDGVVSIQNGGATFEQGAFNNRALRLTGTLQGGGTITVSQLANGAVSSAPSVEGYVEFAGANSFRGPILVTGSALTGDFAGQAGPATLRLSDIQNGGRISNLGQASADAANLILNAGILQYIGPGSTSDRLLTLGTLGAALDASGSGPLRLTNRGALAFSGIGARKLLLTGASPADNSLAAAIGNNSGPTTVHKTGAGTWVLSGANSYSGSTTIDGGTLMLNGNAALGDSPMVALNEGMLVFSNAAATNSIVAAGGRLGSAGLNGTNTVAGSITVTAASLNIHSQAGTGTSSALLITGGINATNKNVEFSEDAGGNPGQIWLLNKPVKLGSGELQGAGARVAVAGNTLGTIHPYNGTLTLETNGAFVGAPALYLGNPGRGRFDLNGHSLIISSLTNTLAADEVTSVLPATLMIANTGDHFYSGLLSGAGLALTKTSAGRVTLSGSNTYGGLTTILWGTLALAGSAGSSSRLPNTPSINVASGSVLDVSGLTNGFSLEAGQLLRGNGSVNGSLTVQAGGTVAPADPATTTLGSLRFSNNLALLPGSTAAVHVARSPLNSDTITVLGNLSLGGTLVVKNVSPTPLAAGDKFKIFDFATASGQFTNILPAVPAPGLSWDTRGLTRDGSLAVISLTLRIDSWHLTATNLTMAGSGGWPDAVYFLVTAANLNLPLHQWRPLATDYFDAAGSFLISNAVDSSAPAGFFRLAVP